MTDEQLNACGCCEGTEPVTPKPVANRPGLDSLTYRVGTHAAFLETMKARLASQMVEADAPLYPLRDLTTRASDDPAIALLDSWAIVADVLTFYQERLANEGYLRTATERRSVLELARLVGYRPRPGVAASVFLAYTLDDHQQEPVVIPAGAKAQSVPGPGEQMQTFETSEPLEARAAWNALKPRLTRPQTQASIEARQSLYLKGITTNLKPGDPLLIGFGPGTPDLFRVMEVIPEATADHTLVTLQEWTTQTAPKSIASRFSIEGDPLAAILPGLIKSPSRPPRTEHYLARSLAQAFAREAEAGLQTLSALKPELNATVKAALAHAQVTGSNSIRVYALRVKAGPFGNNAPKRTMYNKSSGEVEVIGEWPIVEIVDDNIRIERETSNILFLDTSYDKILPGSWIAIDTSAVPVVPADDKPKAQVRPADPPLLITQANTVQSDISRADYGMSGKTTLLELATAWLNITPFVNPLLNGIVARPLPNPQAPQAVLDQDFQVLRRTSIYAQNEELALAEEPITDPLCMQADDATGWIELDGLYSDLKSGRWLIVSGERTDIANTSGVKASERVMLADVQHYADDTLPGDKTHTFIRLSEPLAYCYRRAEVTINANVVKATHGETRAEALGGGDAAQALQTFALRQPPLTFVAAPTPAGAESTLRVYVNEVRWHEAGSLSALGPTDHGFITHTGDDGKTRIIFGNGQHGARLPTGLENVRALYRNMLGQPGNVKAEQISLLATRPLGVTSVINPLRASGGADKESRDQARQNAPLAVMALDRLVSVRDYADFARVFAGIGQAVARRLSDGRRELVHLTIAGADDIPIEVHSDLYLNLVEALRQSGDPHQPVQVQVRELLLLVISANIRIHPDYQWETMATHIRQRLLEAFGFERRALGQDVALSEIICTLQSVKGVAYVDVDLLGGIPEKKLDGDTRRLLTPQEIAGAVQALLNERAAEQTNPDKDKRHPHQRLSVNLADVEGGVLRPAQLALLAPQAPDTFILNRI